MEWIQSLLNGENGSAIQLVLLVLGLAIGLILLVMLFRRIAGTPARKAARNRVPRLSITDVTGVDDKRFLVLARRDNVEHLLLIGGPTDVVVETGIVRTQPAQPQTKNTIAETPPANPTTDAQKPISDDTPAATATAIRVGSVAAAGAAIASTVGDAKEVAVETSSSAVEAAVDAKDAVEEAMTETAEAGIEAVSAVIPDISEAAVEEATVEVAEVAAETEIAEEVPELDTPAVTDLEAEISEKIDDALNIGDLDISVETAAAETDGNAEDEMQKLLDELANETQTPA